MSSSWAGNFCAIAQRGARLLEVQRQLGRDLLGPVTLVCVEDQVYVNDIRIRTGEKDNAVRELGAELARHNVGEVTFHEPLDDAGLRGLVGALGEPPQLLDSDLTITAAGPNLRVVEAMTGIDLPPGSFAVGGRLVRRGDRIDVEDLGVRLGL